MCHALVLSFTQFYYFILLLIVLCEVFLSCDSVMSVEVETNWVILIQTAVNMEATDIRFF